MFIRNYWLFSKHDSHSRKRKDQGFFEVLLVLFQIAVQTDVTVGNALPNVTAEDLQLPEISANYWRRLAERMYGESERAAKLNFEV